MRKLFDEDFLPLQGSVQGVLATREVVERGVRGVGDQFRSGAETYNERYLQVDSKLGVINEAFRLTGTQPLGAEVALDVGCGSGNATFALLEALPDGHVYASDLSPEMIDLLVRRAELMGVRQRITPIVGDSSRLRLRKDAFDVIVGSSMLHHLLDPSGFMERTLGCVRPGGICLFTEPFQAGHLVLRQLLAQLVRLAEGRDGLQPRHVQFFKDYIFTIDTMFRRDRDDHIFEQLDDKWMFTRAAFARVAAKAGMRHLIFQGGAQAGDDGRTLGRSQTVFLDKVTELVRLGLGESIHVPDWMAATIADTDRLIDGDLREELLLEGNIVFAHY